MSQQTFKADIELDLDNPVELVALSVKQQNARCRIVDSNGEITLRAGGLWDVVPGAIVTVRPRKQWRYFGH